MKETHCKICSHRSGRVVLDVTDCPDTYLDYLELPYPKEGRYYIECDRCGFVYRNPTLSLPEKELLYQHFRDQKLRGESPEEYFERITQLSPGQSEIYERCEYLQEFINFEGRVLDVGAGMGVFLFLFKKKFPDWQTIGVEPTMGVSAIAATYGVTIYEKYLGADLIGNRYFDLITSIHVLEHTDNPAEHISMLKAHMKPETLLYIETPSLADVGYLPAQHDRFMCQHEVIFSQASLCTLLKSAGLEIVHTEIFLSRRKRKNLRALCKIQVQ